MEISSRMAATLEKPQIIVHLHKDVNYTLYDAKWIPSSAKFVNIGSHPRGTGALQVFEVSAGGLELKKEVHGCVCINDFHSSEF